MTVPAIADLVEPEPEEDRDGPPLDEVYDDSLDRVYPCGACGGAGWPCRTCGGTGELSDTGPSYW